MNGYLVVMACSHDDLPLSLHSTYEDAVEFAETHDVVDTERIEELLSIDKSEPVCLKVVSFLNGQPSSIKVVRNYEDEPAAS